MSVNYKIGRRRKEEEKMERDGFEKNLGEKELRKSVDEVSNLALDIGGNLFLLLVESNLN